MRLEKIEENEKVQCDNFLDFINCGACYLLAEWINDVKTTVTLNKDTVLEDLSKEHGGRIWYNKFCMKTFRGYKGEGYALEALFYSRDLDEVINWTKIDPYEEHYYTLLLKALVTGEGLGRHSSFECIVRWAKEGSSRGEDWYRLIKD